MLFLLKTGPTPMVESIAVSVPESVELLIFGVGLAIAAVILRSFLAKVEKPKFDDDVVTEA